MDGALEAHFFHIMGAHLTSAKSRSIILSAKAKIMPISPIRGDQSQQRRDREAAPYELNACRTVIEKPPHIGLLVCPLCAYHASNATTKFSLLRRHHIKVLNNTLATLQKHSNSISFHPGNGTTFKLNSLSDEYVGQNDEHTNIMEGILTFRRNLNSVYAISWTWGLAERVAPSTSTAKLLAVADTGNQITYPCDVSSEVDDSCTTKQILESKITFHLCSTARESREVRNKLILASISE